MTLIPSQKIGSYEVVAPIGEGGMGEVYRARDTRLGRDVALKVLPETLATDPERLARFEREAKLLAALNHPSIATLHGLESVEGRPVIVMELVAGETLAERTARAPLSPEEAVAVFTQIADALSAAHGKGIVHRDLKPANVKITPEGQVKVLDFGLAKLAEADPESGSSAASHSPTLTKNTALGAILGTASYMSPEQARGKQVDKRTDIWAFGCCLFESLAGRKAFDGETVADVLSKVLQLEPDWRSLSQATPIGMRRLIERCLAKDPSRRIHDIADARYELEASLSAPVAYGEAPSSSGRGALVPAVVAAALAGGLISWMLSSILTRPETPPRSVQRFSINLPPGDRFITGGIEGPLLAISPDGSKIVYAGIREGAPQLFLRPLDEDESRPIPGTEQARAPFFSPDGRTIGFYQRRRVQKISLEGGPADTIGSLHDLGAAGGAWFGSRIIYGEYGRGLWVASEGGGDNRLLLPQDEAGLQFWPHVLPGGGTVLFGASKHGSPREQSIVAFSLADGRSETIVENAASPRYVGSGHLLFVRETTLLAAPFDLDRMELTGSPVPVLENVARGGAGDGSFSVSRDGTLVYVSDETKPESGLAWVDRQGRSQPLGPRRRATLHAPRLSPDGALVAVAIEPPDFPPDIWLLERELGTFTRMTSGYGVTPMWGAESRELYFTWNDIARVDVEKGLEPEILGAETGCNLLYAIAPDGGSALCDRYEETHRDIDLIPLDSSSEITTVVGSSFDEFSGALSPDNRWLAYVSDESGRHEVYVQPFPGSGRRRQVSRDGGIEPAWSPDGGELFYRNKLDLFRVPFDRDGVAGEAEHLFAVEADTNVGFDTANYDVSADGRHFVMVQSFWNDVRPEIHVIVNWLEELARLVPVE